MRYIGSCWGNRRERDRWGDLGVDECVILGWVCGERAAYRVLVWKMEGKNRWADQVVDV